MRFRYTGQTLLAPLGLYYYKARIYSPTLGRFLQTDPERGLATINNRCPSARRSDSEVGTADDMNLYAYVGNNPINANDPSGLYKQVMGKLTRLSDQELGNSTGGALPAAFYFIGAAGGFTLTADGEPPQGKAAKIADNGISYIFKNGAKLVNLLL